jgi:hypothetical protein
MDGAKGSDDEWEQFCNRCYEAFTELFDAAKAREEVQFAAALNPEFRGERGPGWSTAEESRRALKEYLDLLEKLEASPIKVRVALSLYSHLSEASGFYEVPKNMMRIASGEDYNLWPFRHLASRTEAGARIVPNANKVIKDLVGHAKELGLEKFVGVILETFDADLRNGYAHADYVIWSDGIRLPKRNGGYAAVVSFDTLDVKLNRAIGFFEILNQTALEHVRSYATPKRVVGRMNSKDFPMPTIIEFDKATGAFSITSGIGL